MWCSKRQLRVFLDTPENEWIVETLNEEKQLLYSIKISKISYYGHIMRKTNRLEKVIKQGCISSYRSRGWQRRRWTEDITDWTGLQINMAVRVTEDRHRWHHVMLTANPLGGRHWTTTKYCQHRHLKPAHKRLW